MKKILFVCLGNICRSPAAQGIMKSKLEAAGYQEAIDFEIDSAGTGAWHIGQPPDARSQQVCEVYGIDISTQKARKLTAEDGKEFDYLFGMDYSNLDNMKMIIPEAYHSKLSLFDDKEVNDPYYSHLDGFEIMYQQLEMAAEAQIEKIFNQ